jgi:fatty-acyl-CoA synthase
MICHHNIMEEQDMNVPGYDWIAYHAASTPDKLAQVDLHSGRRFTYREMNDRCDRLAGWLAAERQIRRGDRIAVLAHNSTDLYEIMFTCQKLGAIFVPLNWRLAVPELLAICKDAAPALLFHGAGFEAIAKDIATQAHISDLASLLDGAPSDYERGISREFRCPDRVAVTHDDVWTIMYTSGTTGHPKGAEISYGMVFFSAVNTMLSANISQAARGLTFLPLFHVGGLYLFGGFIFHAGGTNTIMRTFDAARALSVLADPAQGITHVFGVPTNFMLMTQVPGFGTTDLSRVSGLFVGGAPCPLSILEAFAAKGVGVRQGWGMTETATMGTVLTYDKAFEKLGSSGLPVMHAKIRIIDAAGAELPADAVGQLVIKGPTVTRGYWREPEITARSFSDDWFLTGDAAYRDQEGYIYIVDRWKDMYISGGENVYPAEIENVLHQIEGVMAAAVIGVADDRWGEVGCAFIQRKPGSTITEAIIKEHCRAVLARFKHPHHVRFVDELPLTAAGKIAKPQLRSIYSGRQPSEATS